MPTSEPSPPSPPAPLLDELRPIVGPGNVVTDAAVTAGHARDWTGRFVGATPAVVRPGTTAEVAAVVGACARHAVPLVAQGGNTGLVGGSVPLHGEVVLSLRRLREVGDVDVQAGQVTVAAGVTLGALQAHLAGSDWRFAVDLGARDSATIGGMVATNAGGLRAVRYGSMRRHVVGVEAVLADGSIVTHLQGLRKDNTGYDLAGLVTGSEGTLAVVTAARLALVPRLDERTCALVAVAGIDEAVALTALARRTAPGLEAAEMLDAASVALVGDAFALEWPLRTRRGAFVLFEVADRQDPSDQLAEVLDDHRVLDVAVGVEPSARAGLWRWRETVPDAIERRGVPVKLDVTLPPAAVTAFVAEATDLVRHRSPGAAVFVFGHLGDGNLHVNVVGSPPGDGVEGAVLTLVAEAGGSISAEHGIGAAKRPWLRLARGPSEIAVFAALKAALDPDGVLNPHVLLPAARGSADEL